jgi:hypothetical protein
MWAFDALLRWLTPSESPSPRATWVEREGDLEVVGSCNLARRTLCTSEVQDDRIDHLAGELRPVVADDKVGLPTRSLQRPGSAGGLPRRATERHGYRQGLRAERPQLQRPCRSVGSPLTAYGRMAQCSGMTPDWGLTFPPG